jgi:hypothetical protein
MFFFRYDNLLTRRTTNYVIHQDVTASNDLTKSPILGQPLKSPKDGTKKPKNHHLQKT